MAVGLRFSAKNQTPGDAGSNSLFARVDEAIALLKNRSKVNQAIALAVKKEVKAHLVQYNSDHPNAIGGKRTNFYSKAANSTNSDYSSTDCVVGISQIGIRLQILGGTVKPGRNNSSFNGKKTKALSIPADPIAHGHTPAEFDNLIFIPARNKAGNLVGMLCEVADNTVRLKKKKLPKNAESVTEVDIVLAKTGREFRRVIFWLVKQATIKPHPDVVPKREEIIAAARRGIDLIMSAFKKKQTTIPP